MKQILTVDMTVVKNYGANVAVVLAVVQNANGIMSITDVANDIGISYPTAHKCLDLLVGKKLIGKAGKLYRKI